MVVEKKFLFTKKRKYIIANQQDKYLQHIKLITISLQTTGWILSLDICRNLKRFIKNYFIEIKGFGQSIKVNFTLFSCILITTSLILLDLQKICTMNINLPG